MTDKKYRDKYRKNGTCISCGSRPAWEGLVKCKICHKKDMSGADKRKRMKLVLGICYSCKEKVTHGIFCDYHWKLNKKAATENREKRKDLNLCIMCGRPKSDEVDMNFKTGKFFNNCNNCRKAEFAGRRSFNLR